MNDLGPASRHHGEPVRLSVVIPAFNEARRLPGTLRTIMAALDASGRWLPAEIIIVDDGSTDGTAESARAVPPPRGITVRISRHDGNRGKGAAVRTGFGTTRGALVLLSDADLATPIEELDRLAETAGPGIVVIGSRAVDRTLIAVRQPWYRDFMGRTFNVLVRGLLLPGIHDTQCGFKLFPGATAKSLAASQRLDGFAFDVELLLLARLWGLRIEEVGVRWSHVEASRVSPARHSLEMFRDVLRLTWWKHRGLLPARPPSLAVTDAQQSATHPSP
ncbi:MAG: glycosyltransferase family 2 protein [Acidobacteria bacterium]|nr:glycosyltransferase family 2 protein [Acidobacteriota bacterium]